MNNEYTFRKSKRGKGYIPPLLSQRDEFVPDTHIGIYSIFRNEKNTAIYMSESQCQEMRLETYKNVYELYQRYGSRDYVSFFNVNREEINELGMNTFAKNPKFAPVSGLVECFGKQYKLKSNGRKRLAISFGVNKSLLAEYFKRVEESRRTGRKLIVPKLKRASQKQKDIIIFGDTEIDVDGKTLRIERNALYNQFKHWCDITDMPEETAVMMALKAFLEQNPIDGLMELHKYKVQTPFDRYLYVQPKMGEPPEKETIQFDGDIYALARKIIERYNADVENITKVKMDIHSYVNNAVHYLNSNMDLKYTNPELYREQMQLKKMVEQTDL